MTLSIVLILASITIAVVSGFSVFRSYRLLSRRLKAARSHVQMWEQDHSQLLDRLHESKARGSHTRARLALSMAAHRRATARVAEEKRDRIWWRSMFQTVASTLAQRNKENHQLTLERDIAIGEFNRLAKETRVSKGRAKLKALAEV